MSKKFLHIVVDLSIRQITTPEGKSISICQVEANVPILQWHEDPSDEEAGNVYSFGQVLKEDSSLSLDIEPFIVIVKRCADCMCFSVIAPNDVEDSIYHVQCIEQDRVISEKKPRCIIGKVSKGSRYEFDLMVGSLGQMFRIETIPSEDIVLGKSKIIWQEQEEGDA